MKSAAERASEYVLSGECEVMDTYMAHEASYLAGYAACAEDAEELVRALVTIETGLVTTLETAKYAGFRPKEIAREALARWRGEKGE